MVCGCGHQLSPVQSHSSSRVKKAKKAYTVENTNTLAPPIKPAAPYSIYTWYTIIHTGIWVHVLTNSFLAITAGIPIHHYINITSYYIIIYIEWLTKSWYHYTRWYKVTYIIQEFTKGRELPWLMTTPTTYRLSSDIHSLSAHIRANANGTGDRI